MVLTPLNWYIMKYSTRMPNGFSDDGLIRAFRVSWNVGSLSVANNGSV